MHEMSGWVRRRGLSIVLRAGLVAGSTVMSRFCVVVLAIGLWSGCGDSEAFKKAQCEEAREVVATLATVKPASKRVSSERIAAERAKHQKHLVAALGDEFVQECVAASDDYRACVLEAGSSSDVRVCRESHLR